MGDKDVDESSGVDECSNTGLVVTIVVLVLIIVALVGYILFIKNAKFNAVVQERAEQFLTIAPIARRSRLFRQSCIPDEFIRSKPKTVTFHDKIAEVDDAVEAPSGDELDEDAEVWDCECGEVADADCSVAGGDNGDRCCSNIEEEKNQKNEMAQ
jgi:hypothetical protein